LIVAETTINSNCCYYRLSILFIVRSKYFHYRIMAPATAKKRSAAVAGGGGSANDVANLSRSLGISVAAVEAMLAAQGSGIEQPSTTHRSSSRSNNTISAASRTASSTRASSAAWSAFMSEEAPKKEDTKEEQKEEKTSSNNEIDTSSSSDGNVASTKEVSASTSASTPVDSNSSSPDGVLVQTGTLDASIAGRKDKTFTATTVLRPCDLFKPTLLTPELFRAKSVQIRLIATSCSSCHSLCIDTNGNLYGWGRNEEAQLSSSSSGHNWSEQTSKLVVYSPRHMEGPWGSTPLAVAAVGKSHSIVADKNGTAYACGSNKCGQLGINSTAERATSFKKCSILTVSTPTHSSSSSTHPAIRQLSCGEAFTVALDEDGFLYSTGSSQNGQLGNGETGEYIEKAGKVSFANAKQFEQRTLFYSSYDDDSKVTLLPNCNDIQLHHISCGKNHTVAIEKKTSTATPRVFTWGCGNFGCLGHRKQSDEYSPRLVDGLTGPIFNANYPVRAAAGPTCSLVITSAGHLYYWGKHGRSNNEATMRPSLQEQLAHNGHVVKDASAGNTTVFVCTENGSTISWGVGPCGELGHGYSTKANAKPQFVESLDKCLVTQVECGYGHTLFLIRDLDDEDREAIKKLGSVSSQELLAIEDEEGQWLKKSSVQTTAAKKQKKGASSGSATTKKGKGK
jgi:alpha-tubulin suppressor-like RCC1 family protein